ncbi:unnamed protein product [Amoebophrya sp. A25]|nr:unnamed protein product [Amoebophrya sp. A25]|eukprot:GSA25T00013117001.1
MQITAENPLLVQQRVSRRQGGNQGRSHLVALGPGGVDPFAGMQEFGVALQDPRSEQNLNKISGCMAQILMAADWSVELKHDGVHPYFGTLYETNFILPEFLRHRRKLLRILGNTLSNGSSDAAAASGLLDST